MDKPIKKFDPEKALQSLVRRGGGSDSHRQVMEKLDEVLYYLNMIKNSTSVSMGEYTALTRLFTGQLMYVDTRDTSLAPHLLMGGEWEMEVTRLWRKTIRPDSVIFDVGANFGYFGIVAGASIKKQGVQLHMFEPNPDLQPLIEKTLSVNGLSTHTRLVKAAVGDKKGSTVIHRIKDLWGSSTAQSLEKLNTYSPIEAEFDAHFKVPVVTIDDYCAENKIDKIDLMKIDVEGFENAVYDGMRKTIKASEDLVLFLEFTFDAYDKPAEFFKKISDDFQYCYGMQPDGSLERLADYDQARGVAPNEWLMIVASHNPLSSV
jgi:FkbM family methyltransferase